MSKAVSSSAGSARSLQLLGTLGGHLNDLHLLLPGLEHVAKLKDLCPLRHVVKHLKKKTANKKKKNKKKRKTAKKKKRKTAKKKKKKM